MHIFGENKKEEIMKNIPTLEANEFFRVNSYYWQGMVYIAIEEKDGKTLCKIKNSKSQPKWIKTEQLSKEYKEF